MDTKDFKKKLQQETLALAEKEICKEAYPTEDVDHVWEYVHKNMDRYLDTLSLIPANQREKKPRILDIGIAYGFHDVVLKQMGYDIYGTEQKERIPRHCGLPLREGIVIKELDVTEKNLPFEEGFFDLVIFGEVLEHIRDSPVKALRGVGRLIKPGGHLIFTTPNFCRITNIGMLVFRRNPMEPFDLDFDAQKTDRHITDSWTHIREYTLFELMEITKKAGFEVEEVLMSMCWDSYEFNFKYGGFSKGKKSVSYILFLLNKLFKNYRSDIMIRAKKI